MSASTALHYGRAAYARNAWSQAYASLAAADRDQSLDAEDLWRLAMAALLIGRENDFSAYLDRAHRAHLETGNAARAARCAFWIGFELAGKGDLGQASGWFARAKRLLEREAGERVEHGYLLIPLVHQRFAAGDYEAACDLAVEAGRIADRFGDAELHALAVHFQGRALVEQTRLAEGLALMDESMVAVTRGELSPPVTGLIYCSMIGACRRIHAVGRAHEWTTALKQWCDRQPDMVSFTGQCLVYRAEIMQLHGAWPEAIEEARRAGERAARAADRPSLGHAHYIEGEVQRLLGNFDAAEQAYREASRCGREPQPGYALLRLAQGSGDAALAAIRRVLGETSDPLHRTRLLPAHVEIALAGGEVEEARRACRELEAAARGCDAGVHDTIVAHACGAVHLADGDVAAALGLLRRALNGWQKLDAPYEAARVRALLARACHELGDDDAAALEFDAARAAFEQLGAAPDLRRMHARDPRRAADARHGLTARELQVLSLVATGRTNRVIADQLFISEKTVARHVSNIFGKIAVTSRAAATAYAYEHDLVRAEGGESSPRPRST
jgi:DNA-binding CsgD family transcriptional regulator